MITAVCGTVTYILGHTVDIETASGITYAVAVPLSYATELHVGAQVRVPTFLKITEQSSDLYGFRDGAERAFFLRLISVSGVGPKIALQALSQGDVSSLSGAIARGDVAYLTGLSGIGKKTAERMVVELKDTMALWTSSAPAGEAAPSSAAADALLALEGLGYGEKEARAFLRGIDTAGKDAQTILREVLRAIKQ
jgi:holliday junction DNA helicase RuvA